MIDIWHHITSKHDIRKGFVLSILVTYRYLIITLDSICLLKQHNDTNTTRPGYFIRNPNNKCADEHTYLGSLFGSLAVLCLDVK